MTDEELITALRMWSKSELCRKAAARIEQLVATNEVLVKERDEALEWLSASQGYIADAVFALDKQEEAEARAEQLVATNERLEAVLRVVAGNNCITCSAEAFNALFAERHPSPALKGEEG